MPAEQFRNLAETTLASGYTSGGTSITVTSATGFPTTGTFRVALGNAGKTIFRVDSVSGSVFTGAAEEFDANAASSDTVKLVATRAAGERFLQSPDSVEIFAPSGVSGADRYGPLYKVIYPVIGDFAWINQGTASADSQFGYTRMLCPATANNYRILKMTSPATPYQVDILMQYRDASAQKYGGLVFRESSTGKIVVFQFASTTNVCQVVYFSDPATFFSNPANTTLPGSIVGSLFPVWFRIRDDGTNLKFTASRDGRYYFTEMSLGRTAYLAGGPDEIGITGDVEGAGTDSAFDFYHWLVS